MKNKLEINSLKICSIFSIIMIYLFILYTIDNKFQFTQNYTMNDKEKDRKKFRAKLAKGEVMEFT